MAKLEKSVIERLENFGIRKVKTDEEAKTKCIKKLVDCGVEGFEDEDLETMVSILESFVEVKTEADALAEEAEGDEFDEMDRYDLKTYIAENDLEVKVTKKMSDDDVRDAIRLELQANNADDKLDDDDESEDEEDEKPVVKKAVTKEVTKKETAKAAPAPTKKETTKVESKKSEPASKSAKGEKFNPLENEADRELFDVFEDFFPQEKFEWNWVKDGLTIKNKGENGKKVVCYLTSSSTKLIKVWLPCFIGKADILDELGVEYNDKNWNNTPICTQLPQDEAVELMETIKDSIMKVVLKHDAKLGANRAKLEKELAASKVDTKNKVAATKGKK